MKKTFKRVIAVFIVVIMVAAYLPMADYDTIFGVEASALSSNNNAMSNSNAKWSYNTSNKTLTISGSGAMPNYTKTPSYFSDYNWRLVVTIMNNAKTIVINSGITSIGNYTFSGFSNVTAVTIPASVTSIGEGAFKNCTSLSSVSIPASVTSIGKSAFEGCSKLSSVTLNNGLKTIGSYAFKSTKFASVSLPYTVTSVGSNAFANISGLKFTCVYGDAAYNYCKSNSATYTLKTPVLVADAVLDVASKQVVVTLKVNNAAGLNAANFELTYNNGAVPVSTDTSCGDMSDAITTAIVYNGNGKISVGVVVSDCVPFVADTQTITYEIAKIKFKINENADTADFNLSSKAFMIDNSKINVSAVSKSVELHEYVEDSNIAATCAKKGSVVYKCSICAKEKVQETDVNTSNHSGPIEVRNEVAATCSANGYTGDKVCSACGVVIEKGSEIDEGGTHNYEAQVIEADCTNAGYTIYTCSACEVSYRGDNVASLGHDFDENGKCTRCDEVSVTNIAFKDANMTVDNETMNIVSKKANIKVADLLALVDGEGWIVTDAEGNVVADDKLVYTGCTIRSASGTAEYTYVTLGDVNMEGKVTASDARLALRVAANLETIDGIQNIAADTDSNGKVVASDARVILRVSAGIATF